MVTDLSCYNIVMCYIIISCKLYDQHTEVHIVLI